MPGREQGELALGDADEAMRRGDLDGVVAHLSAAVRAFTAAGEPCLAAMACVRLGEVLANFLGNLTAGRAWFVRARRLVEDQPPCLEQGWAAVAAMGCDVGDADELLALAELALERARRFGDVNLETKALADAGLAHVQAGRVAEGMAMLDEAMALACGPADDTDSAAKSVCSFFTACYYAGDFERAASWAGLLRRHGLIGPEGSAPIFLSSHCDSVQATLLVELGRWTEAEGVLLRSRAEFEAAMQSPSFHPDICLADLRIRQGRLAEAEVLLLGKDQAMEALLVAARLHLARGDHSLAIATAGRGLRVLGADRLRAVDLLLVVAQASLATGDLDVAAQACATLVERTSELGLATVTARAAGVRARVAAAAGDRVGAVALLELALDDLDAGRLPWRRALLLIELARLREQDGDAASARLDARAAAAALADLDVLLAPDDLALLRRLNPEDVAHRIGTESVVDRPGPGGRGAALAELRPCGKWWEATYEGTTARLQETKGLRYLADLLQHPGVERHALDLVDRVEGVSADGLDRRRLGDAGEHLDARARAAYRHRIEELRTDAEDAMAADRLDEAEHYEEELNELVGQLARAFGLGGRERRAASAAERARLNVTRSLRAATAKLVDALPGPGSVLDRRIRTGLYCAYEPVAGELRWIVRS